MSMAPPYVSTRNGPWGEQYSGHCLHYQVLSTVPVEYRELHLDWDEVPGYACRYAKLECSGFHYVKSKLSVRSYFKNA